MGGGRNSCFWGAPILHLFVQKCCIFEGLGQNRGAPKTAVPTTTHPILHLTPSDFIPTEHSVKRKEKNAQQETTTSSQGQKQEIQKKQRTDMGSLLFWDLLAFSFPRESANSALVIVLESLTRQFSML